MSISVQAQDSGVGYPTFGQIVNDDVKNQLEENAENTDIQTVATTVDTLRPADSEEKSTPPSISWKERCVAEYKLMAKDAMMFAPKDFALVTTLVFASVLACQTLKDLSEVLNEYNVTEQAQLPFLEKMPVEYSMILGQDTGFSLLVGAAVGSAVAAVGASAGLLQRHVISRLF